MSGNFNIVHPGHLRLLKFAAEMADKLVVGLNPDTAPGVTIPAYLRLEGVQALSIVAHAIVLDTSPAEFISKLRPHVVVKGKEFENAFNAEAAVVEGYGGKIIFSSGDVQFASTELLRQEYSANAKSPVLRDADGFLERHQFSDHNVRAALRKMAGMRVAVVGDIIVDEYISCDPLGMSREDPTIVVSPVDSHSFVGGAGVVALHAKKLGAEAQLFTVFGNDRAAAFARDELDAANISTFGIFDETRPTPRKQRYRALNKTLLRVNHLRQHEISKSLAQQLLDSVVAALPKLDLLLFADFNYGCLPQGLVDAIIEAADDCGTLMAADSQASSQVANIARFKGMSLITPTEHETRLALRDNVSGLAVIATKLREISAAENVVITLGQDGMMIHGREQNGGYVTDRIPALNPMPVDVAGAGDSLFTAMSMALSAKTDIWLASYLGAIAAAFQVSRLGNVPVEVNSLLLEISPTSVW